jgi:hypothetical protein
MFFDKFLEKGRNMRLCGAELRSAILFKIDMNPMSESDRRTLGSEIMKFADVWFKKHYGVSVEHFGVSVEKDDIRNEEQIHKIGKFGLPKAVPPFKNMVLQVSNSEGNPPFLYWFVQRNEKEYSFVILNHYIFNQMAATLGNRIHAYNKSMKQGYNNVILPRMFRIDYYMDKLGDISVKDTCLTGIGRGRNLHSSGLENQPLCLMSFYMGLKILAVINCVNVKARIVNIPEKVQKKRRKKNKLPLFSYRVLEIKGQRIDRGGTESISTNNTRLHLCRGHFKEYTIENPLFGKYTGTYWWQEQIRGNKKKGMIHKDYSMSMSN